MTPKEAYEVLREFNLWRRGKGKYASFFNGSTSDVAILLYTPKQIGEALDVAIDMLKKEALK